MKTVYQLCDELQMNIVAKRHNIGGKWDVRISHAWFNNPILSATGKDSFENAIAELNERTHAIENVRAVIEKKNKARSEKSKLEAANYKDDTDQWYERF